MIFKNEVGPCRRLAAGEWEPGSHLAYINIPKLRNSVVEAAHQLETILADSSSEEED